MGHLDEGALRRMIDEPLAVSERDRGHLDSCARCVGVHSALAQEAAVAAGLLGGSEPAVDAPAALQSVRRRVDALPPGGYVPRLLAPARFQVSGHGRRLVVAGLAAALVAAMTVTGTAGDAVTGAVKIFKPTGVTAVPVSTAGISKADLAGLPDLTGYGTLTWDTKPETTSVDALAKAAAAGLSPLNAGAAYADIVPNYTFISRSQATFKLDAKKAAATAAAAGKPAPVFGPGIDGSTLTLSGGPTLVATYGKLDTQARILPVVLLTSRAPSVTSSGVSVAQLEDFLVRQPGITPAMAAAIRSIGDPIAAGSLPIPIPSEYATSKPVTVSGSYQGVLVKENSGLVSGLIWQKGDTVNAVAGHLTTDQLNAIADAANG